MIKINHKGNFNKTTYFFDRSIKGDYLKIIRKYAEEGVLELRKKTPKDTGKTSLAWTYEIIQSKNSIIIYWNNDNIVDGVPIAIILQYGHVTKNDGYIDGIDYINPAIQPIYKKMIKELWGEVIK